MKNIKCHKVVYVFLRNLFSTIGPKSGEHFTAKRRWQCSMHCSCKVQLFIWDIHIFVLNEWTLNKEFLFVYSQKICNIILNFVHLWIKVLLLFCILQYNKKCICHKSAFMTFILQHIYIIIVTHVSAIKTGMQMFSLKKKENQHLTYVVEI